MPASFHPRLWNYGLVSYGCLLAIGLWFATLSPLSPLPLPVPGDAAAATTLYPAAHNGRRFTMEAALYYQWPRSTLLRITPPSCLATLRVNNTPVDMPKGRRCKGDIFTLDLAPYLQPGINRLTLEFENTRRPREGALRSMHSTGALLLILLCPFFHPLSQRARRLPGWLRAHRQEALLALCLLPLAIWLRLQVLDFISADMNMFLQHWVRHIRLHGLGEAYGRGISNYAPLYTYLLGIADFFFPAARTEHVIKYLSFTGDAFAAYWAYRIAGLHYRNMPHSRMPMMAALLVLLSPSIIVNGAVTAQCDIWFTSFLLGGSYYVLARKPTIALIFAGIAFSLKQQTVFLFPVLLVLLIKGVVPWKRLWIIPAIYLLTCIPAWLEGRPLLEMLRIYYYQVAGHPLNMNAANPYLYLGSMDYVWVKTIGLCIALTCAFAVTAITCRRWHTVTPLSYMLLATLCAGLLPFTLPFMHDRYFFVADVFSLVLGCLRPRWLFLTALFQASSLLAPPPRQFPYLEHWTGWGGDIRLPLGIACNALAIACILWLCRRYLWRKNLSFTQRSV